MTGENVEIESNKLETEKNNSEKPRNKVISIRTTTGRERIVIDSLYNRITGNNIPIKSLFRAEELKGYIFIEGKSGDVEETIENVRHVRGIVNKEVPVSDLERFLIPEKREIKIEVKDTIEIIGGPFKGEKAKVTRKDEDKKEITVELLEAAIPIPVTISVNRARLYEKPKE